MNTLEPTFILHTRPYRNTSALVELFTRDSGRVGLVAKGIRGPRSKQKAALQPFTPVLVSWRSKSELGTLTGIDCHKLPYELKGKHLYCGLYLNEILYRLLHRDDPHPALFITYENTLEKLASQAPYEPILRQFEKQLLIELGYGLDFKAINPNDNYIYTEHQGLKQANNQPNQNLLCFSGKHLAAMANDDWTSPDVLQTAKRLFRQVLAPHLGPKPLKSKELFV